MDSNRTTIEPSQSEKRRNPDFGDYMTDRIERERIFQISVPPLGTEQDTLGLDNFFYYVEECNVMEQEQIFVTFAGGDAGSWRVERMETVAGPGLPSVSRLAVIEGRDSPLPRKAEWFLRGVTSYERYVRRDEHEMLVSQQPLLGRPEATRAALIPIRKSHEWWQLSHDERREIFEEQSHHIATGLSYLPAIARRLFHSRDLGEPFDFLTWFEYSPADPGAFEELVRTLRKSPEWAYVNREVDIRLRRD